MYFISVFLCYVNGRRFRISRKGRSYNWAHKQLVRCRLGTLKKMEERRIALPFVKPSSLTISTISKSDFFNRSLAKNFVAKSAAPFFSWHRVCIADQCGKSHAHHIPFPNGAPISHPCPVWWGFSFYIVRKPYLVPDSISGKCELRDVIQTSIMIEVSLPISSPEKPQLLFIPSILAKFTSW